MTSGISNSEKKPDLGSRMRGTQGSTSNSNTLQGMLNKDPNQVYDAKEEPLNNPESQLRQAIDSLKSSDWQKIFEACNIIKRAAMFHKNLFAHPSNFSS